MKYRLLAQWYENETETDKDGNYSVEAKLSIGLNEEFLNEAKQTKTILIMSSNDLKGFEVDAQRAKAIEDFCTENDIEIE